MRVQDVTKALHKDTNVSEQQVIERLQGFDWAHDFSNDFVKIATGQREMRVIENLVYKLWKNDPDRAIEIWNTYCPYVSEDKNTIPSFIYRLQFHDDKTE